MKRGTLALLLPSTLALAGHLMPVAQAGDVINYRTSVQISRKGLFGTGLQAKAQLKNLGAYAKLIRGTSGLVGYWRLGETTGPTATDETTNLNHGTYTNMTAPTWTGLSMDGVLIGDNNTSTKFDGASRYVNVPVSASMTISGATGISMEAWIRPEGAGQQAILEWSNAGGTLGPSLYQYGAWDQPWANIMPGGACETPGIPGTFVAGLWYHVVSTWEAGLATAPAKLYVNGQFHSYNYATSCVAGTLNTAAPMHIGARVTAAISDASAAAIDEVAVYNRPLTALEVLSHYTTAGYDPYGTQVKRDGAASYWPLNESGGTTAYDYYRARPGTTTGSTAVGALGPLAAGAARDYVAATTVDVNPNSRGYTFDGTSANKVSFDNSNLPYDNFTVEAWVKPPDTSFTCNADSTAAATSMFATGTVWGAEATGSSGRFGSGVGIGRNCIEFGYYNGTMPSMGWFTIGSIAPVGTLASKWHHLVVAVGAKRPRIYLDGNWMHTGLATAAGTRLYPPAMIGASPVGGAGFDGAISEAAIYPTTLTSTQVIKHYLASRLNAPIVSASDPTAFSIYKATVLGDEPYAYWRLNEGSGVVARDAVSQLHNGTYSGGFTWNASIAVKDYSATAATTYSAVISAAGDQITLPVNAPAAWGSYSVEFWYLPGTFTNQADLYTPVIYEDSAAPSTCNKWGNFAVVPYVAGTNRHFVMGSGNFLGCGGTCGAGDYNPCILSNRLLSGGPALPARKLGAGWQHLAYAYDGATAILYHNGANVSSRAISGMISPFKNLIIGNAAGQFAQGRYAEVAIYDHALSPESVNRHMNAAIGTHLEIIP